MNIVAIDYETALLDGTPSVEYYRDDFRAVSMAVSGYREGQIISDYAIGEEHIRLMLEKIMEENFSVIVHNFQFEYGVTKYRFPDIKLNWHADTMRLVQVADNGSKEEDEEGFSLGLKLQAAISRWLEPQYHNHKEPYYQYIREQGVKKGKEGQNLHLLPPDMLRTYNVADSDNTLRLYQTLTTYFKEQEYNWQVDHALYLSSAKEIAEAKGRGIRVDRQKLEQNIKDLSHEIGFLGHEFTEKFKTQIAQIEQENLETIVKTCKTEKGQIKAWERCLDNYLYEFNLTSVKQKARLFVDILGIKPQFFTEKGSPAFGKAFLKSYGEGGKMLEKRGTMMIALRQMEALYKLSERDGKYHVDLRACGTKTGRKAGGRLD